MKRWKVFEGFMQRDEMGNIGGWLGNLIHCAQRQYEVQCVNGVNTISALQLASVNSINRPRQSLHSVSCQW